ncbi:ABC transporter ATP-binding protein [Alkalibacter mobilis]|uniref:ABC transporter ATP-binding protein n=1 Tax=Alkalibacter mobilis TaxID=2787712 RepID=UPI00189D90FA|nr:ABC transporter ATP-binding protein [Alkalibacter mobilis]MBF7097313.1 ABC transporter ATP-binding protein [Alkalibacter mobilis]
MNGILSVCDLSFSYPEKDVVKNVTFDMGQGDVVCLMGPNGCGKTTLLDNIMSIHQASKGEIFLMEKPLSKYNRRDVAKHMAYVPQIHQVVFPYTVEQIVMMGRTAHVGQLGEPGIKDMENCRKAMEMVGISDFAKKPYNQLSGGEIKLVLLARALSQQARLLVMDEPTANLDFKNELVFLETIVKLNMMDKLSILIATHSPVHAFYFQEKGLNVEVIMMSEGAVYSKGSPEHVITEENISNVYGVRSRIFKEMCTDGSSIRSMALLGTL